MMKWCKKKLHHYDQNAEPFCSECQKIVKKKSYESIRHTSDYKKRTAAAAARWRDRHPNKYREAVLLNKYGITLEQYNDMLRSQSHVCEICNKPETTVGKNGKVIELSVDHDHETGKVRGLLCHNCNSVLGLSKDEPEILSKAIKYLDSYGKS